MDPLIRQLRRPGRAANELIEFLGALNDGSFDKTIPTKVPSGLSVGERSATVTASTNCTLAEIDEKRFLFLVQQTPTFALNVMRLLSHRLRRMNGMVKG